MIVLRFCPLCYSSVTMWHRAFFIFFCFFVINIVVVIELSFVLSPCPSSPLLFSSPPPSRVEQTRRCQSSCQELLLAHQYVHYTHTHTCSRSHSQLITPVCIQVTPINEHESKQILKRYFVASNNCGHFDLMWHWDNVFLRLSFLSMVLLTIAPPFLRISA